MSFIQFKDIDLTFQTKTQRIPIFKDFNLEIEEGCFATVFGASGKGKSTLLNLISSFVKPNSGTVIAAGRNINSLRGKELCQFRNKSIGYIFQAFHLIHEYNVIDNIAVPLRIAGLHRNEAREIVRPRLAEFSLSNREKEYPATLSGGEQQRVACLRALINKPSLILADEPTGNLDARNGQLVIDILRRAQEEDGTTVLCVSHDPRIIEQSDVKINIEDFTQVE